MESTKVQGGDATSNGNGGDGGHNVSFKSTDRVKEKRMFGAAFKKAPRLWLNMKWFIAALILISVYRTAGLPVVVVNNAGNEVGYGIEHKLHEPSTDNENLIVKLRDAQESYVENESATATAVIASTTPKIAALGRNLQEHFDGNEECKELQPSTYTEDQKKAAVKPGIVPMSCMQSIIPESVFPQTIACTVSGESKRCFDPFSRIRCTVDSSHKKRVEFPTMGLEISVAQHGSVTPLGADVFCKTDYEFHPDLSWFESGNTKFTFWCEHRATVVVGYGCAALGVYSAERDELKCVAEMQDVQKLINIRIAELKAELSELESAASDGKH